MRRNGLCTSLSWTRLTRYASSGFDSAGRLLELVVLRFDSGNELVIHAMKARAQYLDVIV